MNHVPNPEVTHVPVLQSLENGILRLTLNDATKRNALSEAMLDALSTTLHDAGENRDVRVVIIGADGPVFSSGHNLKELTAARSQPDGGKAYFADIMRQCSTVMQQIVNLPKPVIADIRGTATAAGCQLVASCDLAYATPTSRFATPGVNIGLFCSTPMVALSRNVSNKHAMELLLTGEFADAQRAAEIGLINRVVAEENMDEALGEVASKIASKSAVTLKIGKQAFYAQRELPLAEAYEYASQTMVENMMKADANEGIQAFLDKRPPNWQDA